MPLRSSLALALALALAAPVLAQDAAQTARAYLAARAPALGLAPADLAEAAVTDAYASRRSGTTHVYLQQRLGGVPVEGALYTVSVGREGRVAHAAGRFEAALATRATGAAALGAADAVRAAARHHGLGAPAALAPLAAPTGATQAVTFDAGAFARGPVEAALVYAPDGQALRLAWKTVLPTADGQHVWVTLVDAQSGRALGVSDRVVHDRWEAPASTADVALAAQPLDWHPPMAAAAAPAAASAPVVRGRAGTYNVLSAPVESPIHGVRSAVADPHDLFASPHGWHDTDGVPGAEHTLTRGNNVFAYIDADDNNAPDANGAPDGGEALAFDFEFNQFADPSQYRPAAVTNLFYWNNVIHDVLWHYGFDEPAGNFQQNNYGNGGAGNDYVHAEAQDGGGTNNANFYTPSDGQNPRMQMYLWSQTTPRRDGDFDNGIIAHEYGHGWSIRLTGGPNNVDCLNNSEQMGEGWSDYLGLMLTMDADDVATQRRGVGNYALGLPTDGNGIRPAPYSTDFAVNNYTYGRIGGQAVPHGVGFVWATVLWEVTWALIEEHGFDADVYDAGGAAGNQIALQLVNEAMKMQPCSPGFVDGRDAILAADEALYDGAHTELLWEAFARRGLGSGADQGSSSNTGDETESFVVPEYVAPNAVADLAAAAVSAGVQLTWTATGDDGDEGTAAGLDIRWADAPILTDDDFAAATRVTVAHALAPGGEPDTVAVGGLDFETAYHFAMRVRDDVGNTSPLSNSVFATTLAAPVGAVSVAEMDVEVELGENGAATFALTNAGPSDLTFSIALEEAATRAAGAPAPPAPHYAKGAAEPTLPAQRLDQGGPDAFGYRWIDSNEPGGPTFDWIDISATGTRLQLSDDASQTVALPFAFEFYGTDRNAVRIGSNGFLDFDGTSNDFSNDPIPSSSEPNGFIAAFWDDLNPANGGEVRYEDLGDGRFVVSWLGVPHYPSAGSYTFQAVLYANGQVRFQYQELVGDVASATIGLENDDASDGLQVVYNAPYAEDGLAIVFRKLWVTATPEVGSVQPDGTAEVALAFESAAMPEGLYRAVMTIQTNDPALPSVEVPISLRVGDFVRGEAGAGLPAAYALDGVFPNPFSGATAVRYALPEAAAVRVVVYDVLGREVAVVEDARREAGRHTAQWDARGAATGVYVVRVTAGPFTEARKVLLVR